MIQKLDDDFDDLDEIEELSPEDQAAYKEMEEYYESSLKKFKEGEIIQGRVIHLTKDNVTVDVGFKSEGVISLREFNESEKNLEIGDEIEVFLERSEDNDGIVVLSKEKANKIKIWEKLVTAFEAEEIIEGTVVAKAKGGLTVDIGLKLMRLSNYIVRTSSFLLSIPGTNNQNFCRPWKITFRPV